MRIRYNAEALSELAEIADHFRSLNPAAGAKIRESIDAAIRIIVENPLSGRRQDAPGVRKSVTRQYGNLIFYAVDGAVGAIDILGIQHPARARRYSDE